MKEPTKSLGRKLGELVAAVGVIVSLVFVGLELRQNTAAVRGTAVQELTGTSIEVLLGLATDAELAEIVVRWREDPASLDPVERYRLSTALMAIGRNMENAFQQYAVGTMSSDLWQGYMEVWRFTASAPGFADWWRGAESRFSSDFRAYVDTAVIGVAPATAPPESPPGS